MVSEVDVVEGDKLKDSFSIPTGSMKLCLASQNGGSFGGDCFNLNEWLELNQFYLASKFR